MVFVFFTKGFNCTILGVLWVVEFLGSSVAEERSRIIRWVNLTKVHFWTNIYYGYLRIMFRMWFNILLSLIFKNIWAWSSTALMIIILLNCEKLCYWNNFYCSYNYIIVKDIILWCKSCDVVNDVVIWWLLNKYPNRVSNLN